jgi:hypothetical protein
MTTLATATSTPRVSDELEVLHPQPPCPGGVISKGLLNESREPRTVQLQSIRANYHCLICVLSTARALHVVDNTFARVFESLSLRCVVNRAPPVRSLSAVRLRHQVSAPPGPRASETRLTGRLNYFLKTPEDKPWLGLLFGASFIPASVQEVIFLVPSSSRRAARRSRLLRR